MTTILAVYFGLFSYNYFVIYPTKFNFPKDLEVPFSLVKDNKNPTLISNRLPIHYMYVLFYTSYPISEFQKNNKNTNYDIRFVGNFYIDPDYIQADKITDFDFMLSNSQNECLTTDNKVAVEIIIYQNDDWKVGNCKISYR
jgi:hypothetical protein